MSRGHRIGAIRRTTKNVVKPCVIMQAELAVIRESEDGFIGWIIDFARNHGWLVYHVRNSRRGIVQGDVGFPDLVLCDGNSTLFVEVKSETGKLEPDQIRWAVRLIGSGAIWDLWRPSDRALIEARLEDHAAAGPLLSWPGGQEEARRAEGRAGGLAPIMRGRR